MQFGDLAGNAAVKRQLAALVDAGHFPHALLLEGDVGSGRRTLAGIIARAAVCGGDAERPCGVCDACRKSAHPDIAVYGEESGTLSVDTVRDLRGQAYVLPNEAAYRVIILQNAHMMTPQAQNALLKILEEPPARVIFILTCENRSQMLETIRSRCVCLTMQPVTYEEALPVLRARLPQAQEDALEQAHSLFGGRIGQVIAGMQDGTLQQVLEITPALADALVATDELSLIRLTARMEKDRPLIEGVLASLQLVLRDALAVRVGATAMLSTAPDAARRLAARLTGKQLAALAHVVEDLQRALNRNMNNTLFLTYMSACLRQAAGR